MFDYVISGWSFFFRWPVSNAKVFQPLGVFLGPVLQAFVFLFFCALGYYLLNPAARHYVPAIGFLGLSMLTGFFHEDGLADTADSLGVSKFDSQASLEKIHSTFKDPRLGTFGVSALVIFWGFRFFAVSLGQISVMTWVFICLTSRATSLALGLWYSSQYELARSARSSHVMQMVSPSRAGLFLLTSTAVGAALCFVLDARGVLWTKGFGITAQLNHGFSFLLSYCLMLVAARLIFGGLVKRTEALNGDLLGALVCFCEFFLTISILKTF